ncbi:MAG: cupredoxin domain-containing protein [Anaerolineales bacterium]|nr:cupredoxin domain-containing protein [Anaerolineales bacterium]
MKSKLSFGLTIVALGVALTISGCSGGAAATPAGADFTVGAMDTFKYDPAALTVKAGEPVTIILDNKGVLEHNFVIDDFNLHVGPVAGGAKSEAHTFTPTTPGTYTFYCDVPGHKEAGMIGTLTVN